MNMIGLISKSDWCTVGQASLLAFALVMTPNDSRAEGYDEAMAKVLTDWGRRQNAIRSLCVTWDEDVTWAKGFLSERGSDRSNVVPPSDRAFTTTNNRLRLKGNLVRIEMTHSGWDSQTRTLKHAGSIEVFGLEGRLTHLSFPALGTHPMGLLQTQKTFVSGGIPSVRSILMTVRGLDPTLSSYKPDRLEFTGRSIVIAGKKCNELVERSPGVSSDRPTTYLWVDPMRDNVITRYAYLSREGRLAFQLDVSYAKSETGEWLPASWNSKNPRADGSISVSYRGRCVIDSINAEVAENEFRVSFPPGTKVYDYTAAQSDQDQPARYIVREDGSNRYVRPSDGNRTYEELLDSPDPEQSTERRSRIVKFIAFFVVLSLTGLVGFRLIRRRFARMAS